VYPIRFEQAQLAQHPAPYKGITDAQTKIAAETTSSPDISPLLDNFSGAVEQFPV
jgi:hypothetical protein